MAHQYVYGLGTSSSIVRFGSDRSFAAGHNTLPSTAHPAIVDFREKTGSCKNCESAAMIGVAVIVLWLATR